MWFSNVLAKNNPREVDMPVKSINQSKSNAFIYFYRNYKWFEECNNTIE